MTLIPVGQAQQRFLPFAAADRRCKEGRRERAVVFDPGNHPQEKNQQVLPHPNSGDGKRKSVRREDDWEKTQPN